jgi:hypothetical protein
MKSIPFRIGPADLEPRYTTEREWPIRFRKRLFDALGLDFRFPPAPCRDGGCRVERTVPIEMIRYAAVACYPRGAKAALEGGHVIKTIEPDEATGEIAALYDAEKNQWAV